MISAVWLEKTDLPFEVARFGQSGSLDNRRSPINTSSPNHTDEGICYIGLAIYRTNRFQYVWQAEILCQNSIGMPPENLWIINGGIDIRFLADPRPRCIRFHHAFHYAEISS